MVITFGSLDREREGVLNAFFNFPNISQEFAGMHIA